jgi:hypothetical protein
VTSSVVRPSDGPGERLAVDVAGLYRGVPEPPCVREGVRRRTGSRPLAPRLAGARPAPEASRYSRLSATWRNSPRRARSRSRPRRGLQARDERRAPGLNAARFTFGGRVS